MFFSVEVCPNCRRMFRYPGFGVKLCPECKETDMSDQKKVKEYIREHGAANMHKIAADTGIPVSTIRQYLRDSMLEIPEGSPVYIKCESCGCDIRSGRWCSVCASKMSLEFKGMYAGIGDIPKSKADHR